MPVTLPALPVHQWLDVWDRVQFDDTKKRRKPDSKFYMFSISARDFVRLANVYQRRADGPRAEEQAIQRRSASDRVDEISKFIEGGYPWSDISDRQKLQPQFQDLRMPGWLPTAVVANILPPGAERLGKRLLKADTVKIDESGDNIKIVLPDDFTNPDWAPDVKPIEVIDGQHRLLAFQIEDIDPDFQIPVVAFYNLDVTWQAYLFYTINIKPKKINTSLAFDLYPLLRVQDWLDKSSSAPAVYRETRAQEITEILWSYPESPWYRRISMLGDQSNFVSQAAFIRALVNSYIRKWDSNTIGGLFGAEIDDRSGEVLAWTRSQQSAFILTLWGLFESAVRRSSSDWAENLRLSTADELFQDEKDPAFWGQYSLIASDQGVRGFSQITNDIFYTLSYPLGLGDWIMPRVAESEGIDFESVSLAMTSLQDQPFVRVMVDLVEDLAKFDWRSPVSPGLDEATLVRQSGFKGSSGYKEMRRRLLALLGQSDDVQIREATAIVQRKIR